jgi:hypothetical protein
MGRAIDQDGVIALINCKVEAAQAKIDVWNASFEALTKEQRLNENDPIAMEARVSAMNAVKGHLKFIEDYKFPAATTQTLDELLPDMVLRDKVTGRYYQNSATFVDDPRDAFIFPTNHHKHVGATQEMVPYKDAVKSHSNPRPLPPEVAMIEEIEQAEHRSK